MTDFQSGPIRTESTTESTTVSATVEQCVAVALDIASYPDWAEGITAAEILDLDGQGRPLRVHFEAAAFGRTTTYELDYDYSRLPELLGWSLHKGDVMRTLNGSYQFAVSKDRPDMTDVTYELQIELAVPLPGFVRRRAEARIVTNALHRFTSRVEEFQFKQ